MIKFLGFRIIYIFFIFKLNFFLICGTNYCQNKKVGIYDHTKFPDSLFSHNQPYYHYKPQDVRLFADGPITGWNTIAYGSAWVQVDLGF